MFQTGIKPQWEDPKNEKGGEFKFDMVGFKQDEELQNLWESSIFDLITGNFPHADDGIAGVRLVQKVRQGQLNMYRVEVWCLNGEENCEINQKIKEYI